VWIIGKMHADGTGGGNTILRGTGARIGVSVSVRVGKYHDFFENIKISKIS